MTSNKLLIDYDYSLLSAHYLTNLYVSYGSNCSTIFIRNFPLIVETWVTILILSNSVLIGYNSQFISHSLENEIPNNILLIDVSQDKKTNNSIQCYDCANYPHFKNEKSLSIKVVGSPWIDPYIKNWNNLFYFIWIIFHFFFLLSWILLIMLIFIQILNISNTKHI